MQHKLNKLALALLGLHCGVAMAAQFSDAYFFGDSLTDSGAFVNHPYNSIPALAPLQPMYAATNNKFTSTGGKVWSEFLAQTLAGRTLVANNPLNPVNAPATGTNYAQGGAQVNTTPGVGQTAPNSPALAALSVKQQVDTFLAQKGAVADPNALYAVYGGANDVFYLAAFLNTAQNNPAGVPAFIAQTTGPVKAIMMQIAAGTLTPSAGATAALAQSTSDLRDQVARLKAAGAKYILVPLLPDMGRTPAGLSSATVGGTLTSLSTGYNSLLQKTLGDAGLNIIPIDTVSLTNDIQANPSKYGLTNSTTPGCAGAAAVSSLICTSMVSGGDSFMFADTVHPTQATHQILANYVAGVTNTLLNVAPALANTMSTLALANGDNVARIIDNHTRTLEGTRNLSGDYRIFMDLSSNPTDIDATGYGPSFNAKSSTGNVTVGVDLLLSPSGYAGFALGRHEYGGKFSEGTAKLDAEETSLSFYGKAFAGKAYVGWLLGMGMIDYTHVDTTLNAGLAADIKHGETTGDRKIARLLAGMPFSMGTVSLTPKLDLTQQNLHISAFGDSGNNFSRMTMGKQNIKSLVGGAGLALEGQFQASGFALRPYLEGSYKHEFKDDPRSVMVGVGSMTIGYNADLPEVDTSYGTVDAGINFDVNKATTIGINFAKTLGLNNIDQQHYGMSISSRF